MAVQETWKAPGNVRIFTIGAASKIKPYPIYL
jgi:hypothetical protein